MDMTLLKNESVLRPESEGDAFRWFALLSSFNLLEKVCTNSPIPSF